MSKLERVLKLVSEEQLDEVIRHLNPATRQAIAAGQGEMHTQEIVEVVWHILEEAEQQRERQGRL